ncbi:MAG: hypothetical protein AAFX00_11420 [Pseudomonadota bacterium]
MIYFAYFAVALAALLALASMILKVGTYMGDCPVSSRAAKAGAVTIATGFLAMGGGAVILIAAVLPLIEVPSVGLLAALGVACLGLGLGFTNAVATLRAVVADAPARASLKEEAA